MLRRLLASFWWVFLLRGIAALLFGALALVAPAATISALVMTFAVFAVASGVLAIVGAVQLRGASAHWWVWLFQGLAGVVVGMLTFRNPGITALVLLFFIAAHAILTGLFEVVTAVRVRKEIEGEGWIIAAGVASILFGVLLVARPGAGALALITVIGAYAAVVGVLLLLGAFRLRRFATA
ncbi:MAG TPA: HdeD family acid-resistance protein [Gemmatimonadales bacterium]|nr:HdeD family acid-resistance protein [Gemmatimonadales bacterium]